MKEDELYEALRAAKVEKDRAWNDFGRAHRVYQEAHKAEALAWLKYQAHLERPALQEGAGP